jgi:nucleoside-diphosphate-sugar epimerase
MSYLVLGSSGLVGRAFCKYLQSKNKQAIEWDIKENADFDLRNTNNLNRLSSYVKKVDYILFAAFDIGGAKFIESIDITTFTNNLQIMLNVFPKLVNTKFIFLSSHMSNLVDNKYGISKNVGENFTQMYNGINVRMWNIYGFEATIDIRSHVVPDFVDMALKTNSINMLTDGTEEKQFIYDEDCAAALYTVFENYGELRGRSPLHTN